MFQGFNVQRFNVQGFNVQGFNVQEYKIFWNLEFGTWVFVAPHEIVIGIFGIWDLVFGTWNLGLGIWALDL